MKKFRLLLILALLLALALPVSNLFAKPDNDGALVALGLNAPAVAAIPEAKCVVCHTQGAQLPYYATFPMAGDMMRADIEAALKHLDWGEQAPTSEVALAKLEHAVSSQTMPPTKYKLAHWDAGLTEEERGTILAWVRDTRAEHYATGAATEARANYPVQPLVPPSGQDPDLVALGKELYHDVRLSGDDTISCATCHDLDKGGTDQLPFSKGIGDQVGGINAPTVYNAGPIIAQFWDGRAADLAEQAGGPVENPIEMGAEWPVVVAKLEQDPGYVASFQRLFADGLTRANVQQAIAAFEETLVTIDSPFDRWLTGEDGALDANAQIGFDLFLANACATCHVGAIMGGQSFELMGRKQDYFATRGGVTEADAGRANVTKKPDDTHKFKVPTLRNIAVTHPYFHDGSTSDLGEVVATMARCQNGRALSAEETAAIVAFLESLTGTYEGQPLK